MKNDKIFKKLLILIKLFNNRPNHLVKYLMDNNAFDDEFLSKVTTSKKLDKLKKLDKFSNIDEIEDFFISLLDDDKDDDITIKYNLKLEKLLNLEKYEEACKVRDYMIRNNINFLI